MSKPSSYNKIKYDTLPVIAYNDLLEEYRGDCKISYRFGYLETVFKLIFGPRYLSM